MTDKQQVIYSIDSRPPVLRTFFLALQHVLTMFGATVAVPLLLGSQMQMEPAQLATLISSVMMCAGVATLLQSTLGTRLPIIQGTSFSFLPAFFAVIAYGNTQGLTAPEMLQLIAGSIIVGSIVETFLGFSGLVGHIRRALSPVVVGPVIMLIGLALFEHGAPKAGTHWPTSGLTILLVIVFSLVLSRRMKFFQVFPILSAVVIVFAVCAVFSAVGVYQEGHSAYINLEQVKQSKWLRVNPVELFLPWGNPQFKTGFIVATLAGFLASIIESVGDYHACAHMSGAGQPTSRQISRGIGCEGLGRLFAGLFGGLTTTSYSENIGLIGLTRVGSRYVVQVAALLLILLGVFAKFGAFAATIPGPLVGGLYCVLFGLISAVGMQQLAKADLSSNRNMLIAGFSLFMGLSVPAYFKGPVLDYQPSAADLLASIPDQLAWLKELISAVGRTGMAVAAIIGIVLDNVIPGTLAERGLTADDSDRDGSKFE